MVIGISGKIGSGKDTVGKIIQYLTSESSNKTGKRYRDFNTFLARGGGEALRNFDHHYHSNFEIKKFADTLKDMVCMLIGCTREQLENHEFKDTELGEEWIQYAYADGHYDFYQNGKTSKRMHSVFCDKEKYEEERRINWQTAYKTPLTPRLLLQLLGTECGRNIIHKDIWVNALFSKYIREYRQHPDIEYVESKDYPNWIITDMRFPNEKEAVEKRRGTTIRVERDFDIKVQYSGNEDNYTLEKFDKNNPRHIALKEATIKNQHPSETALDDSTFNYTIENNGTIEELIDKVREILIKEKIITNR